MFLALISHPVQVARSSEFHPSSDSHQTYKMTKCINVKKHIKTLNTVFQDRKIHKVSLQCFAFLIIYVIIWTGPSSYRIYQFFHDGEEVFWLVPGFNFNFSKLFEAFIHALILPMQGFLNFIAYMGPLFYEHCRIFFHIYVFKNPGRVDGRLFTLNRASIITREDSNEKVLTSTAAVSV